MKKYLDCFVPIYMCNFSCHYCYVSLLDNFQKRKQSFPHSVEEMRRALSRERLGEGVYINLCAGGETLLIEDSVALIRALLEEGHHIAVVTNGSLTQRFEELVAFPRELTKRLFLKFSYHYIELKKKNLLDTYFANVRRMREAGASFTIEITPSDELIPLATEARERCERELGAAPHLTIARDDRKNGIDVLSKMGFEEYKRTWESFNSGLFKYKAYLYKHKIKSFCYAGDWTSYVNLATGEMRPCNCGAVLGNIYDDIDAPLPKRAMGHYCELPYCYNGHGWLSMGAAPDEKHPVYTELRNRVATDGSEWVSAEYQRFWAEQLFDSNPLYSDEQKRAADSYRHHEKYRPRKVLGRIYHRLARTLKYWGKK